MKLFEISAMTFYHGSSDKLPVGTILKGRGDEYSAEWGNSGFYKILEYYRPSNMLAHSEAVFMTDNDDDLDSAGGGTDWVFTLRPLGRVERHDMNWGSEISMILDETNDLDDYRFEEMANNYWSGKPSYDPLWEYLTPSASIIAVEEF